MWFPVLMPNTDARPGTGQLRLYTIPQTAELLGGVSTMHVYRLIAARQLRTVNIASPGAKRPKTRVRSDDFAEYVECQTSTA